jgi:1,4-dihydroxy-2-naphthoyl-CoA synthase
MITLTPTSTPLSANFEAGSVILTLNRPERANSFNLEMVTELQGAFAAGKQAFDHAVLPNLKKHSTTRESCRRKREN